MKESSKSKEYKIIKFPTDYHPLDLSDTNSDSSHADEEKSLNSDNIQNNAALANEKQPNSTDNTKNIPKWDSEEEWFKAIIHRTQFIDHITLKKHLRCSDPIINRYIKPEVHYLSTTPQGIKGESHIYYDFEELTSFLKKTTMVMRRTIMINLYGYPDLINEETIKKVQQYLNLGKKSSQRTRESLEEYLKYNFTPFYLAHVKVNKKSTAKLYTQCKLFPYPYEGSLLNDKFIGKEDLIIKNEGNTDLRPLSLRSETIDKILFETAMIEIDYFCISDAKEDTQQQSESSDIVPNENRTEEKISHNSSAEGEETIRTNRMSRLFLKEERYEEKKPHYNSENSPEQWIRVGYESWMNFINAKQDSQVKNSQKSEENSKVTKDTDDTLIQLEAQDFDSTTKKIARSFLDKIGYDNKADKPDSETIESYATEKDSMIDGTGIYFRFMNDIISHGKKRVFLSGKAGTGKTTMICVLIRLLQHMGKKIMLCATTGTAAYNINQYLDQMPSLEKDIQCSTVHTAFKIKDSVFPYTTKGSADIPELINSDAIIIDEISMMRMDVFRYVMRSISKADEVCRQRFNETHSEAEVYNEKQVILVGDFFQLPPVITESDKFHLNINHWPKDWIEKGGYAFFAPDWNDASFETFKLKEAFRQKDDSAFYGLLDKIRYNKRDKEGNLDNDIITYLNKRYQSYLDSKKSLTDTIHLLGRRADAEEHNFIMQDKLRKPFRVYEATPQKGSYKLSDNEKEIYNISSPLKLKTGDKIITTKNDPHHRYYNGRFGTVKELGDDYVTVEFKNGESCKIEKVDYIINDIRSDEPYTDFNASSPKVKVVIKQFPLQLAYALTIHKAQGMTLESACIDPGAWENGQLYTALSRLKRIDDLYLLRSFNASMLKTSSEVIAFDKINDKESTEGQKDIGISSPPSEESLLNNSRIADIIKYSSYINKKVYDHTFLSQLSSEMLEKLYELTKQALDVVNPPNDDTAAKTEDTSESTGKSDKADSESSREKTTSYAEGMTQADTLSQVETDNTSSTATINIDTCAEPSKISTDAANKNQDDTLNILNIGVPVSEEEPAASHSKISDESYEPSPEIKVIPATPSVKKELPAKESSFETGEESIHLTHNVLSQN